VSTSQNVYSCRWAGIPPPSLTAGGVEPLTERNSRQAEGKARAGSHSSTLGSHGECGLEPRSRGFGAAAQWAAGFRSCCLLQGPAHPFLLHSEGNKWQKPFTGRHSHGHRMEHTTGKGGTCSTPQRNGSSRTAQAGTPV